MTLIIGDVGSIVTNRGILKSLTKLYNLEFDSTYYYYTGNAYKDSKGNYLPTYMYLNGNVYKLKYFDGCFKPYVVVCDSSKYNGRGRTRVESVVHVPNKHSYEFYDGKFGTRFSMV